MIKRWLSRLGTFFLYLMSLLPFWFLYLVADVLFVIIYYVTGYRKKVVRENLKNSFPEKSEAERLTIERKYYRYLAELIVETVKAISISPKEIVKRTNALNPELLQHYLDLGKSITIVTGHYANWEFAALAVSLVTDKKRIIVYKPQSNVIFNDFFNKTRSRFGATLVSMKQTFRRMIEYKNETTISILLSDQTPAKEEATYFTSFLNQPAAVFLGIEKLSKLVDSVVIFCRIEPVRRGYYKSTLVPLVEEPARTKPFEITEIHVKYLETIIKEQPQYWLWSHRRWKVKPEDVQK